MIVGDDPVDRPVSSVHPVPPNPMESIGARIRDLDVDSIRRYLAQKLGFYEAPEAAAPPSQVLEEVNLDGVVKWIKSERCKNIITLAGAGISTCKYNKLVNKPIIITIVRKYNNIIVYYLFTYHFITSVPP